MFESSLIDLETSRQSRRKWGPLPVALALHGAVLAVVCLAQVWNVEAVSEPDTVIPYHAVSEPEIPAASTGPRPTQPTTPVRTQTPVQPDIQQIPDDKWQRGFRGTGLPPVVDTEMERSINALTKNDIIQMLGDKLSEDEIKAALDRHEGVKQHIAQLRAEDMIIEPTQWGDMDVQFLLTPENSYVGRDRDRAQRIEAKRAEQEAAAANDNW